ncbi:hypothetical protein HanIR_Chr02g0051401 [Helianthus annuus]|nr:hypothetical protein HanIR_Chr02g0051401 [Helianthus annuus]
MQKRICTIKICQDYANLKVDHGLVSTGHVPCWVIEVYNFVFSTDTWARPRAHSVLLFLLGKMLSRGRACHVYSFSCIYVRFSCLFAYFVHLSSFNPENTKGRQKHTFSNISTKKG